MAASVAQFAQVANWHVTTTPQTVSGLSWSSGDIIIAVGLGDDSGSSFTLNTPTNANLSFTLEASATGSSSESVAYLWKATAGSSESSQTISMTATGPAGNHRGLGVWVCSGVGSTANASGNRTEAAFSVNPTAGSIVIYGMADYNLVVGSQTQLAGSGTATERWDNEGSFYAAYGGDWVGVSTGSQSFGITTYTSMRVSHVVIEVLATVGDTESTSPVDTVGLTDNAVADLTIGGYPIEHYPLIGERSTRQRSTALDRSDDFADLVLSMILPTVVQIVAGTDWVQTPVDVIGLTDQALGIRYSVIANDVVGLTDTVDTNVTGGFQYLVEITDLFGIVDSTTRSELPPLETIAVNTVGITDSTTRAVRTTGITVLNDADALYLGNDEVSKAYVGSTQVWP